MKTSKILRAARRKIRTPTQWTKGWYARDVDGHTVSSRCPEAVCWCGYGAVSFVVSSANLSGIGVYSALYAAVGKSFISWQDAPERTHAEVLVAFDRAIAEREAVGD